MELPDWVKKHKTKGTEVRKFKDTYYLYKISSKWDKTLKRPKKITEKFLGKITQEELISPKIERIKKDISIKEFGASNCITQMNLDIINDLKILFPDYWKELYITSVFRLLYQSPIKNLVFLYNNSFLQKTFPKANLSARNLSNMFKAVGERRNLIVSFFKKYLLGNEHILFDVTSISSHSNNLSINHLGYNNSSNFDPQINLMYIFSADKKMPIYYRILPGNIREIKAFKNCIKESNLKNAIIITDKGFYSEDNIKALESENLNYIIPLKRNSNLIKYEKIKQGNKKQFDGYFAFNNRIIWFYSYQNKKQKVFIFLDFKLKSQEEEDYLFRIEKKHEGYNKDDFLEKQFSFGTLSVVTNQNDSAEKIYQYFKERNHIELMFDALKNVLNADRTYMRNEKSLESWIFVNHLSIIYYYKLYQTLIDLDLLKKYSPKDILLYFSQIKKIKINDDWVISEITHKTKELFTAFHNHIT